jgi:hypothetical protein
MHARTSLPAVRRILGPVAPVPRAAAAAGALLVVLSLFSTWNYVSDQPVSGWDNYARTDWLIALAALVAAAGAALPARRAGRVLEFAGAALVVAFLLRIATAGDFVRGPALASLGALLVLAMVVVEGLPAPVRARLGRVASPAARAAAPVGRAASRAASAQ